MEFNLIIMGECNKSLKKVLIILILSLGSISLSAQDNSRKWTTESTFGIGFAADGLSIKINKIDYYGLSIGEYYKILSSLQIGGGIGIDVMKFPKDGHSTRWLANGFADVRYTPLKKAFSPELGVQFGGKYDISCKAPGWYSAPYIGIKYSRFSFRILYDMTRLVFDESYWVSNGVGADSYEKPDRDPDGYTHISFGDNLLSFSLAVRF